jgi:alpha-L-rhamnosidase
LRTAAWTFAALAACAGAPSPAGWSPPPVDLRCEYLTEPLGVQTLVPRLSWTIADPARGAVQSAFQILAASQARLLTADAADLWNSGVVEGDRTLHVEWRGEPLGEVFGPGRRCWWTVRVRDGDGRWSPYADATWFETGLWREIDWGGTWIGDGGEVPARDEDFYGDRPAPRFRKSFRLPGAPLRARLYVCGLGYHVASLNGARVGDHRLDPAWTRYDRLVPYVVHDVTELLQSGENVLGVELGNGWYDPLPLRLWGKLNLREHLAIGRPKLRCRLVAELEDGTAAIVVSDSTWRTAPGPVVRNNVYLGERHDARREQPGWDRAGYDDAAWTSAVAAVPPGGQLTWLPMPPIRATRELEPVAITEPEPGVHVADFGQNFAGVARLRVEAPAGTQVVLRFAEELRDDGTIDVSSTVAAQVKSAGVGGPGAPDVAWQEDRFTCAGGGVEVFEPRFCWHGFRYVEITGLPRAPVAGDVTGVRWNTDLRDVSSFQCSNQLLNRIQEVVEWTLLSNAFGVLSDCPARERFGYGGDMVASADAYLANFDMAGLHAKAVGDFAREARPTGGLPECAPDVGVNERGLTDDTGPIGWMFAHPLLTEDSWRWYGNTRLVDEQYDTLMEFVAFCRERIPAGETMACLGDHGVVGPNPPGVHATVTWRRIAQIAAEFADLRGEHERAVDLRALAERIREAFGRWIMPGGVVLVPTQTSQATALWHGIVPGELREEAFAVLLDEIEKNGGRLTTGMFGTGFLLELLSDSGRDDLAYSIVATREYPGYGWMIDQGATTLWEHWSRMEHWSRNHPMYSAVSAWFQHSLLGIRQADGSVAWSEIVVKPSVVGDLEWARGHLDTVRGRIRSEWRRDGGGLSLDVDVPANTRAVIFVPMLGERQREVREGETVIAEGGAATGADPAVEVRAVTGSACEVRVGGGRYRFVVR